MRVLLDTSYLYELTEFGFEQTPPPIRTLLTDGAVTVFVSVISIWEVRIKWNTFDRFGQRKSPITPGEAVATSEVAGATFLPFDLTHAATSLATPLAHKDPFDEQLLVQAQVEDMRLLTRDRLMVDHPLAYRP